MKKIIRYILLFAFSIATTAQLMGNIDYDNSVQTLLFASLILAIFEIILKPIIKLLLLPITILTLGLIRIVINTLGLYLAVFLVSELKVNNIHIPSYHLQGIITKETTLENFAAYIATSAVISLVFYFLSKILVVKTKISS